MCKSIQQFPEFTATHIQKYHNKHVEKAVEFWYNIKNRCMQNKKQKEYRQHSGTKNKHIGFDIDTLSWPDSGDSCSGCTSSLGDEGEG